jgi:hypothetical protein
LRLNGWQRRRHRLLAASGPATSSESHQHGHCERSHEQSSKRRRVKRGGVGCGQSRSELTVIENEAGNAGNQGAGREQANDGNEPKHEAVTRGGCDSHSQGEAENLNDDHAKSETDGTESPCNFGRTNGPGSTQHIREWRDDQ